MQSSMLNANVLRTRPFTNAASSGASRPARHPVVVRASKDATPQQPSDLVMKTVGIAAAAQMAFLPFAGAAMADAKPPVKAGTDVGEAVQGAVPEGAANPKTREERNTSRDAGLADKLNTIKDRFDADKVVEGANTGDVFFGSAKNKSQGVSFNVTDAPALQGLLHTVGEPVSAGDRAQKPPTVDPLAPKNDDLLISEPSSAADLAGKVQDQVDDAASKVKEAASKPTAFAPGIPQVNVSEKLNKAAGSAAADAGQTLKDTASGDPTSAAKSAASDVGDAAKKAAAKLPGVGSKPVAFSSAGLQVNVDLPNPVEQTKDAARESAATVKAQAGQNPLEALKNKIDEASITGNSPQKQLDQAGDAAQQLKNQRNVSFAPRGRKLFLADKGNASNAGPKGNEGGVSQTGDDQEQFSSGKGNALLGGDLKDSRSNENAAQNNPSLVGKTAGQQDAAPRSSSDNTSSAPAALGGKNLVRPDSESPEQTAQANIAKARQSSGNAVDSLKSGLGLQ